MIELFKDISPAVKNDIKFLTRLALAQTDPEIGAKLISNYMNLCSEEEQEFVETYFKIQLELAKNETNNND